VKLAMTQTQQLFALYNPALLPADVLLAEFTARRPMLETLLGIVRGNKPGHPPQHCLLIGVRGAGKTTTLWAVAHSLSRDADLARQWQPVVFDEESRRVGDLADFWLEAIRQWEHVTQDSSGRAQGLLEEAPADIEERAQRTFMEMVVKSSKRALLLIDNFNDLLGSIHDPEPLHRLRAFLMKESRVMIIGAATRTFDEISSIDEPFNDFFRCFELRPLSLDEMRDCLLNLAERRGDESVKLTLQKHDGTVRTLHLLTGGNPRLVKTFYRLLQEGLRGDIRRDLERLLDEFTPYFKAIVDALPGQQQRIFDAVALAWDPVEVATVATATRLPSNQVSAQLRALVKNGLLSEATGSPKRKTYLLTDRFSNIHYLMRHGRAARNRLDWFVALVRLVFDSEAEVILARVAREAAECGPEGQRDARAVLYSAFNRAGSVEARRNLLHATLRESWDSGTLESLAEWFDTERFKRDLPEIEIVAFFKQMPPDLRKKLGYKPGSAAWWFKLTDFLEEKKAWPLAEAAYRKAIELDPADVYPWTYLGNLLTNIGRSAEAEAAYRKAIELDPKSALPYMFLGQLLENTGRSAEAEAAYRRATELAPSDSTPWGALGNLLTDIGRHAEAEAAYRRAIELDPSDAYLWTFLGNLFARIGRLADAEAAYRRSIDLAPREPYWWIRLAAVLVLKGGAVVEARACLVKAVALDPQDAYPRSIFVDVCAAFPEDWTAVLPSVAEWCATHPDANDAFDFAVDGLLRLARLTKPSEALALLDSLRDATPFETLRDALRAHDNRDHLHHLAPERRAIAIELLERLSQPPAKVRSKLSQPK
jgi:tetratricopeptide (TPR) repeat protein